MNFGLPSPSLGLPTIPGFAPSFSSALLSLGGAMLINQIFDNQWGIFDQSGFPVLLADTVVEVDYAATSKIPQEPIEMGSFAHYNKVIEPFTATVKMTKSTGGVFARAAFVAELEALAGSIDLFTVITPEAIFPNCNIVSFAYQRDISKGSRMITATLSLKEVRQVTGQYIQTKVTDTSAANKPGSSATSACGNVSAVCVTNQSVQASASKVACSCSAPAGQVGGV